MVFIEMEIVMLVGVDDDDGIDYQVIKYEEMMNGEIKKMK
jgi:hypothetical protein